MTVDNRLSLPGVVAHINFDRAIEGTNPALHTTGRIGGHLPLDKAGAVGPFFLEEMI